MTAAILIVALLLSVAFWRHVVAALAAGVIVLVVLGIVFVVLTVSAGTGPNAFAG
jgi:hypothetical protein